MQAGARACIVGIQHLPRFAVLESAFVTAPPDIVLPVPGTSGGMSLLDALRQRHSTREFSTRVLSPQLLSNLLWAADGVNRADTGGRTAPSARNWQEIDIYAALPQGLYRYDAARHRLVALAADDLRQNTGLQDFVGRAPLNLLYVADLDRTDTVGNDERRFYSAADAGFIAQNVYLFCASSGLATVVRGLVDRPALARAMGLRPQQRVLLAQTVGYPA